MGFTTIIPATTISDFNCFTHSCWMSGDHVVVQLLSYPWFNFYFSLFFMIMSIKQLGQ